jgi:hypothetical protein
MKRNGTATTAPEDGATVYVLAADNIGQYVIPFPVVFRAGGTLAREKSSILLSRDGAHPTMSNDDARCMEKLARRSRLSRPD